MSDPPIPRAPALTVPTGSSGGALPAGATGRSAADGPAGARGQVVAMTGAGPLVRLGAAIWLLDGGPRLDPGTAVRVRLGDATAGGHRPARLLAIDTRALEPPATVRALPARGVADPAPPQSSRPPGIEVAVRLIGAGLRPVGATAMVRLSALPPDGAPDPTPTVAGSATPRPPAVRTTGVPSVGPGTIDRAPVVVTTDPGTGPRLLEALVVRRDALGKVWLQATGRLLEVQTPLALPLGARLQLRLPEGLVWPPAVATDDDAAGDAGPARELAARQRPDEVRGELARPGSSPGPSQPDDGLAARLLRLIAALEVTGGRASMEPDDGVTRAHRASPPTAELARGAGEPPSVGWRSVALPWGAHDGGQLRLFLPADRGEVDEDGADARGGQEPPPRRAVFELELRRLGHLQLDALCRGKRFDLAVRSAQPLEPALQGEIRALFEHACDLAGLTGQLDFRTPDLLMLAEAPPSVRHRITV